VAGNYNRISLKILDNFDNIYYIGNGENCRFPFNGGTKMTVRELKCEESLIDNYVQLIYPKFNGKKKPDLDGITDIEKYLNSKYRICWVLKEPDEEKIGNNGGIDLRKLHQKYIKMGDHHFDSTWEMIGMVSYLILNGLKSQDAISRLEKYKYMQSLLQIAFINLSKMPSKIVSLTKEDDLWGYYEYWKPILNWQLAKYDSDIIIFGDTDRYFWNDLDLDNGKFKKTNDGVYVLKNGKIYICVNHPAQRNITHEAYVNNILGIVRKEESYIRRKSAI
jgi:hypothetical protein